jgi:nucleotidyltransferase substrate binding protein (TIGR01987 family)
MKKLDNFSNSLDVLKGADFELANNNVIYRTGVIGQFNLTFELAWKALQEVLRIHGAEGAETGSPREILQLGYKFGFINDSSVWMLMLKKRNLSIHIYNEDEIDEMLLLTRDSFIPAFASLEETLKQKLKDAGELDGGNADVLHT